MNTRSSGIRIAAIAIAVLPAVTGSVMAASDFPAKKPVTMIVPFGAGGPTDAVARFFAHDAEKVLGQTVVVKNVTGAAGTIGAAELAAAEPDGYTIGYIPTGPLATQPHLRKMPYEATSFEYVCRLVDEPNVLVAKKGGPCRTVGDIVKDAKANPSKLVYVAAPGGMPHISMIAFNKAYGLQMKSIPGDSAEAAKHIAAGTAQFHSTPPDLLARYDLQGVAFFSAQRHPSYPDIPTFTELGKDLVFTTWFGLVAPKGLPADVLAKLEGGCKQVAESDSFKANMERAQSPIAYLGAAEFKIFAMKQYDMLGQLLTEAGLKK